MEVKLTADIKPYYDFKVGELFKVVEVSEDTITIEQVQEEHNGTIRN